MTTAILLVGLMIEFLRISPALSAEPRFSAEDVLTGVALNGRQCDGPGRIKVDAGGQPECLRFYGTAPDRARGDPVVFLDGDLVFQAGQTQDGQAIWNVHGFYTQLSPGLMQTEAERFALSAERTFINLARPGAYGSTGHHRQRRREREVALIDAALDQLKLRFGWTRMTLAGQSGGGHLVAALMARRNDIGCAIIAAGNVAVKIRAAERGKAEDMTGYADSVDPIDQVAEIGRHPPGRIVLLTDPQDQTVSASSQGAFRDALRAVGVTVEQRMIIGYGPQRHDLRVPAIVAALTCAPD